MAEKDYYSILGLTDEDKKLRGKDFNDKVSKNFRKLSLKWHPDKWVSASEEERKAAEEKFKEISEAHSVLSDENKRAEYDARSSGGGFNGFPGGFPGGFNPFKHTGGRGFPGFNFKFGGQDERGATPGTDIGVKVTITLEEALNGTTKEITFDKEIPCEHCHGTGAEDGKMETCPHCGGSGMIGNTTYRGNSVFTSYQPCPHCQGRGKWPAKRCSYCGGTGVKKESVTTTINIPRGVDNGMRVAYTGMGNASTNGGPNGALVVYFEVLPNSMFERDGENLIYYDKVPFTDALLGYTKTIGCIDGGSVVLKVPELTNHLTEFKFAGRGMPYIDAYGREMGRGDLIVVVYHLLPKKLSNSQKEMLRKFGK
jgi:molecular chaperone DnaJ